ncbi:hypothetical protein Y032_0064g3482 [Ancylostoma ceylanicum]|uniref:Uncharacterized protein n=1 Tax=Ancylostoma ceylanicum TaxID=53326 RepID=A0A016U061_9BILA|nr:hypothetical protein Y032_0064g3482 [Ancylostoma ceylanicum]
MSATSWKIISFPKWNRFSGNSIQFSLIRNHRNSAPIANLRTFSNLCVETENSSAGMFPNWKNRSWIAGLEMLAMRGYISVWISFPTYMFLDTASGGRIYPCWTCWARFHGCIARRNQDSKPNFTSYVS